MYPLTTDMFFFNDSNYYERFQSLNTMPLAISTDTEMVHTAFMNQPTLGFVPSFPLGT